MSAKKQSKRCHHIVKGRLCKNYVKEGELCHIHSKKKMEATDFSSILKQEIKQKYMNNIEEVQQEVISGKISNELKIKIKNHSDKTGLDEELIINSIKTDKVSASFFAKNPLTENITELKEKLNEKLSNNGENPSCLNDGNLLNKKQETSTKSIQGNKLLQKTSEVDLDKQYIIILFNNNVKRVDICTEDENKKHSGKEGHWLETKMGIKHNAKNEPDINGYEMKKYSKKITVGDFTANEYAFSGKNKRNFINILNNWTDEIKLSRSDFIKTFGNPNPNKNNRYSWSGKCVPKYNNWNSNGQTLTINEHDDIIIYYSYSKDTRCIKVDFPLFLQNDNIVIAVWTSAKMKPHIDKKFNNKGFFICKKIDNKYEKICFGRAFNFEYFIECIKNKKIIFDSGMYDGNSRNYSHFRGSCFWDELIIEEY